MLATPFAAPVGPSPPSAIVAIPAHNEAARIESCLAALATQRDGCGAPLPVGCFAVLVYANNCSDATAAIATAFAATSPHPIAVVEAHHEARCAHAGSARKAAMDLAADRLEAAGHRDGILLTTDADSMVSPTWIAANLDELVRPVDCVAGYIDAVPLEILRLGSPFMDRSRLEDRYLRLVAEIEARCDPRPHDPWPNHRVSSGASLAVTLRAYRAVGGLPALPLGEDVAFTRRVEAAGLLVRHALTVTVSTSCRLDGRAQGGAADTMRLRHAVADAPCDDGMETAARVLRRARLRGGLRQAHAAGLLDDPAWGRRLGFSAATWTDLRRCPAKTVFEPFWEHASAISPVLASAPPLRPRDLPREILRAEAVLTRLRRPMPAGRATAQAGRDRQPAARLAEIA